jgi:hypothetical protein
MNLKTVLQKENGRSKQREENIVSGAKAKVYRVLYFQCGDKNSSVIWWCGIVCHLRKHTVKTQDNKHINV